MELPEPIARNALRLLQYLRERERRPEPELPEIPAVSKVIGLTPDDTSDLIDILDSKGAIKANRSIAGGAAPMLTGSGKLMLEVLSEELGAKGAVVTDVRDELCTLPPGPNAEDAQAPPAPKSESSPEPQELEHYPDYTSVKWRGHEYQFNKNQAACVRLLHEAWLEGTPYLSGHCLLTTIEGAVKMSGLFRRHPAWKRLILMGDRKATYRLNLSPQIRPTGAPNPPVKRP